MNYPTIAILSQDIFSIKPQDILATEVLATMVAGEFVYGRKRLD